MLVDCFRFISGNISYFIIELSVVILHMIVISKLIKKNRKFFLHGFFRTSVLCVILDIIYRTLHFDFSQGVNISGKIFRFIFLFLGTYAFMLISTTCLLYTVAFLTTYIVLTVRSSV